MCAWLKCAGKHCRSVVKQSFIMRAMIVINMAVSSKVSLLIRVGVVSILVLVTFRHTATSMVHASNAPSVYSNTNCGCHKPDKNSSWKEVILIHDLWSHNPEIIRYLINRLNFNYPGLESAKLVLEKGDTLSAVQEIINYYRGGDSTEWLRYKTYEFNNPGERSRAKLLLKNKITRGYGPAEIPITEFGGWDWTYYGPRNDAEFGYNLNRHRFFLDLLKAWQETGESKYAEKFDLLIRDWVFHNPLPDKDHAIWEVLRTTTQELDWRDIHEVIWRVLEAGIRMGESWPQVFYGFQEAEEFSPAARIMMLSSIPVHAQYMMDHHAIGHNHATMEFNGLGLAGLAFPEFKDAELWVDYALEKMEEELNIQVYPDGVQTELTSTYQTVALNHFETMVRNYRKAGRDVSHRYLERIESMYDYLAWSMRPDGHIPLNNDSDRSYIRPRILNAAGIFDRPEWVYIATNGQNGNSPEGFPSRTFPWSGIHVMRNGWDAMGHWSFFHTGPYGTGHQHRDKLHLSIHAYGRDLLVDTGRYTHEDYFSFDPTNWRGYFRSSFSQNVILIDGAGQDVWERIADKPLQEGVDYAITDDYVFAIDTFDGGYEGVEGHAEHTRAVLYVIGKYWVVVDRIVTDRPRKLEALWHYAPDLTVEIEQDGNGSMEPGLHRVASTDAGKGNLTIIPAGSLAWRTELVSGQTEPVIRGWYSETYGEKEPNPTAVYTTDIEENAVFAWVMKPSKGPAAPLEVAWITDDLPDAFSKWENVKIKITTSEEAPRLITIPLNGGEPQVEP